MLAVPLLNSARLLHQPGNHMHTYWCLCVCVYVCVYCLQVVFFKQKYLELADMDYFAL